MPKDEQKQKQKLSETEMEMESTLREINAALLRMIVEFKVIMKDIQSHGGG